MPGGGPESTTCEEEAGAGMVMPDGGKGMPGGGDNNDVIPGGDDDVIPGGDGNDAMPGGGASGRLLGVDTGG